MKFITTIWFYLRPLNNWRRLKWMFAIALRFIFQFLLKYAGKSEVRRLEGELRASVAGQTKLIHRAQVHYNHLMNEHLCLKKDFEELKRSYDKVRKYKLKEVTKQANKLVEMGKLLGYEHQRDREKGDGKELIELKNETFQLAAIMKDSHLAVYIANLTSEGMTNEDARDFAKKFNCDPETMDALLNPSQDLRLDPLFKAPDIFAAPTIKAMEDAGIPVEQQKLLQG